MQNLMPPVDTSDNAFHDGDPTTGQLGTIVTAEWLNNVQGATRDTQAEIIAVLTKAGMQPNPQKKNQLAEAIGLIIGNGNYATSGDLTLGLSKKIDKADIAHQLGNDTTKVPSLHLVATELGKKAPSNVADGKLAKSENGADIPDKPKFIENLGLGEVFQVKGNYGDKSSSQTQIFEAGVVSRGDISSGGILAVSSGSDQLSIVINPETHQYELKQRINGVWAGGVALPDKPGKLALSIESVPVGGSVIWNNSSPIPANYWKHDGRSFSASEYPEAAKVFPDLKVPKDGGYFIRISDDGAGVDPGRTVGTYQEDAGRNLTGIIYSRSSTSVNPGAVISSSGAFTTEVQTAGSKSNGIGIEGTERNGDKTLLDASKQWPTANEFRPKNVSKYLIVRMK